ncbi:MAG TPA: hypothetical protein PLJ27_20730, partial [Polyangiaceae bacterium]|nr:hypothetical protein [Polyangiaceae bacterium]
MTTCGPNPSRDEHREVFEFGYSVFRRRASIENDVLRLDRGARSVELRLSALVHLYLQPRNAVQVLWLAEKTDRPTGRVHKVVANATDPGLHSLVEAIVRRRPEIDLRGYSSRQAFRLMKVRDTAGRMIFGLPFLLPIGIGIWLLPYLAHGLDFGEERVSAMSLSQHRSYGSHNVVITGAKARLHESTEVVTSHFRRFGPAVETTRTLVPLVPPSWEPSQTVPVVLEVSEMTAFEEAAIERTVKFRGIKRDILWEGLSQEDRAYLTHQAGLHLADDVWLMEYRANPRYDLFVFLAGTGTALGIAAAISVGLWLQQRSIRKTNEP